MRIVHNSQLCQRAITDLLLDVLDGVGRLDVKGDGLAGQGLDEDLHTATEAEHEAHTSHIKAQTRTNLSKFCVSTTLNSATRSPRPTVRILG